MIRSSSAALVAVALAVVTAGCSDGADEAAPPEVLGLQIDRETATPTPQPDVAVTPEVDPSPETVAPTPSPEPSTAPPAASPPPIASSPAPPPPPPTVAPTTAPSTPPPARPTPQPTPSAPASPSPHAAPSPVAPVALSTRQGHSYVTWFRSEEQAADGTTTTTWGEISAAPPVTRGAPTEPLRVTLAPVDDPAAAVRTPTCIGYVEVDPDADPLRVHGEVRVTVTVDGAPAADRTAAVDATVAPGERLDVTALTGPDVDVERHEQVSCAISFVAS